MVLTESRLWPLLVTVGLFCGLLVAANAAGAKLIAVGNLAASATVFAYALSFLATDLIAEFYGKRAAHVTVWAGFAAVFVGALFFQAALIAPPAPFFEGQEAYETVFGVSFRIFAGGMIAYIVSQNLDVLIYRALKKRMKDRHLWVRNNVSTMVSQFVDTVIFIVIAFAGVFDNLWDIILGQYLIKVVIAAADTFLIYLSRYLFRKYIVVRSAAQ